MVISITFDDGYENHRKAAEIIKSKGFLGTFFITTNKLNKKGFLSEQSLIDINKMGHEIGSHSHKHRLFSFIRSPLKDLLNSKKILESLINKKVFSFAYPYGRCFFYRKNTVKKVFNCARKFRPYNIENVSTKETFELKTIGFDSYATNKKTFFDLLNREDKDLWLIITLHSIEEFGNKWSTKPKDFLELLEKIKESGHKVETLENMLKYKYENNTRNIA